MKIKEIKLRQFGKHYEKDLKLSNITLIKGDNGSGKSTILEAINYALNGQVRRLPKKLESISKLSSDGSLSVELSTNENIITRSITKGKKLSETLECSTIDNSLTYTEKNLILSNTYNLDELLLNPLNFINLSSSDKSKYILSLLNDVTINKSNIISELETKFQSSQLALNCINELKADGNLVDLLDSCLKLATSQKRLLSKELNDNTDSFKIEDLKRDIQLFDLKELEKIPEISKELSEMKYNLKIANDKKEKKVALNKQIETIKKNNSTLNIKTIEKESKELSDKLGKLYSIKPNNELESQLNDLKDELLKIKEAGLSIKYKIETANDKMANLVNLNLRIKTISQSKRCVIDSSIPCNTQFNNSSNKLLTEINELKNEIIGLQNSRNELAQKYIVKNQEISKVKDLYEKAKATYTKAQLEIQSLNKKSDDLNKRSREILEYNLTLASLEKSFNEIVLEDTTILSKIIAVKEDELNQLHIKNKQYIELSQALKLAEMNDKSKDLKENDLAQLKVLEKEIKKIKLELLEEGIKPIKNTMNEILKELQFNYVVFINNDGKKATLGFTKKGYDNKDVNVEIDMLSTGETMIFILALIGAIYKKKNSNFKLLALDDIDNLDKENLHKLFSMSNILEKYFDNILFIGILNDLDISKYKNISVINM